MYLLIAILIIASIAIVLIYRKIKQYICGTVNPKKNKQIIEIIHDSGTKSFLNSLIYANNDNINISTYVKFISDYNAANKDEDIHIIIKTTGGSLCASESICNCILNHTGKGKIICYIKEYCFSGGFFIAICCNKIIMHKTSICGPCDAQISVGILDGTYPINAVIKTVEGKLEHNHKIKEPWLANYEICKIIKERQKEFVKKIASSKGFAEEMEQKLFDEFFSGKYSHDHPMNSALISEILNYVEVRDVMVLPN